MLNKIDKVLHDQIHSSMMSKDPKTLLDNPRLQILDKLYDNYKLKIEGVIADVGCGSGYFGIGLAKKISKCIKGRLYRGICKSSKRINST